MSFQLSCKKMFSNGGAWGGGLPFLTVTPKADYCLLGYEYYANATISSSATAYSGNANIFEREVLVI